MINKLFYNKLNFFKYSFNSSLFKGFMIPPLPPPPPLPRGGVTRQGVVLTDLQSLLDCQ